MIETVRILLGRPGRETTHYECRRCGTGLPASASECPACHSSEVARFEL
ncbi:MAG: hypothetical protein ABEH59_12535 [Halobacteriales archaeon]